MKIKTFFKKHSVRDYLAVLFSSMSLQVINMVRGFVVASVLGPFHYGVLKSIEMITMLEKYGNLGFTAVAVREVSHFQGNNDYVAMERIRNNAYTSEFVLSFVLLIVGMLSCVYIPSVSMKIIVVFASFRLFFAKLTNIFNSEAIIEKQFMLMSKVTLFTGFISAFLVIGTVYAFNIYAVVLMPVIGSIAAIVIYRMKMSFPYRFQLDRVEVLRQLSIGIPLILGTLAVGAYRYAERIMVLTQLDFAQLGYYGLATMIMNYAVSLLLMAVKVRKVGVFEKIGKKQYGVVHKQVLFETSYLIGLATLMVVGVWFSIDMIIATILPKFEGAGLACRLLALALPIRMLTPYCNIVSVSRTVNKQALFAPIQIIATLFFVGSVFVVAYCGSISLTTIIIADIGGYLVFHLLCLAVYIRYFIKDYVVRRV